MNNETPESGGCPLLEDLLKQKGLQLRGIYRNRDAAEIFGVTARTVQEWCRDGKLPSRDLPGRGRFLGRDLECFLRNSARKAELLREKKGSVL
jgi:transposase